MNVTVEPDLDLPSIAPEKYNQKNFNFRKSCNYTTIFGQADYYLCSSSFPLTPKIKFKRSLKWFILIDYNRDCHLVSLLLLWHEMPIRLASSKTTWTLIVPASPWSRPWYKFMFLDRLKEAIASSSPAVEVELCNLEMNKVKDNRNVQQAIIVLNEPSRTYWKL